MNSKHELAQKLFLKSFGRCRERRSEAYKQGVKHALLFRLAGEKILPPYAIGTAESDAWLSGVDEGDLIYRIHGYQK